MNAKRLNWTLRGVIAVMALGLILGAYQINNILAAKSNSLTSLKAKSLALNQESIGLQKSKKDIQKYANLNKIAKSVVPADKDQAEAVREIVNIAGANGISLSAINFPASTLGQQTPVASASAGPTKPVVPSTRTGSISQLLPVKNISGIYQLPITIISDQTQPVAYSQFISFLSALENNRRTAQVSSILLAPDAKDHPPEQSKSDPDIFPKHLGIERGWNRRSLQP